MSRIELHCPSCGFDVPMTLLPPPAMFTCPGCGETMPREKLTRLKVLHRQIAGSQSSTGMTAHLLGTGSFFDATQATASLTIPNCVFQSGDACVVCIADNVVGGSAGPSSITVGGLAMSIVNGASTSQDDQTGTTAIRANITAGAKSIVIGTFGANPTACAAVVLAIRMGRLTGVVDESAVSPGTGTAFDSTATNNIDTIGQIAISAVAYEDSSGSGNPTFNDGFTFLSIAGTDQAGPPNNTAVAVAYKLLSTTAGAQSTGTIPNDVDWVCTLATFRPL